MDKYTTSKYLVIVEPVKKVAELVKTAYSMNIPLILLVPFEMMYQYSSRWCLMQG